MVNRQWSMGNLLAHNPPMHILAISGSLRAASSNTAVLRAAALLAPSDVAVTLCDAIAQLPHFNPDLDIAPPPAAVQSWRAAISASDALLISAPEYAHGLPGALKNALDWLVSGVEMTDKPVGLINTTQFAMYAPAALAETLRTIGARVIPDACLTFTQAIRSVSAESICADAAHASQLRHVIDALQRSAPV
jgi:chromate reductase, NAD(P)H dehydrogenase (quinone)